MIQDDEILRPRAPELPDSPPPFHPHVYESAQISTIMAEQSKTCLSPI